MPLNTRITAHFEQSGHLKLELADLLATPIAKSADMIAQALLNEKKVLSCGNGGAAASAQYFASLLLNRYEMERPSLATIALSADNITLTSIANDSHFEQVFARQIQGLGQTGDVLLAISASGNSANILNAIKAAKERDMPVIALSGGDGGTLVELLDDKDIHIGVPHDSPIRVQEVYILILHCLCDAVDCLLLGVH
jgi:D-sedoheptulose 7-phosphate isomerase